MTTRYTPWRNTGERCKHGQPIEARTVRTEILQPPGYWDEVETRCCRDCEGEV